MASHWRKIVGIVAVLAGLAGLFLWSRQEPPPEATVETLRLGAYAGDVGALEWIAQDKGFFRRVGLEVTITGYPSGNAAVDALRKGEVEIATAADLVVAKRSFEEPDLRILADICRYWNKGLIGRRDRGITTAADLKGKRIGVPATSSAEHNLIVFLALENLSAGDVTIKDLPPAKLVAAMAEGSIDAGIVWQPHVLEIQRRLGDNAVTLMEGGTEANLLLVASAQAMPRASVLQKLMRGLILAEDWAAAHPDEAKAYLADRFKLDPAYLDILWPRMQLAVTLPQEILAAMDSEARWLAKGQASTPDFSKTMHAAPLLAVKPAAVTLFTK